MSDALPIRMTLPPGFLDEEVRCETALDARQKRVLAVQLDLLKAFLGLCKAHGIKVVAFAGTLLGAVRHRGFIPWDDDADLCMDRTNFKKLLNLKSEDVPSPYFLQTALSDRKYFCPYARFRNSKTTGAIVGEDDPDYNNGLYIDVFVLDGYAYNSLVVKLQQKIRSTLVLVLENLQHGKPLQGHPLATAVNWLRPVWRLVGYERLYRLYGRVLSAMTDRTDRLTMFTHDSWFYSRYWLYKRELDDTVMLPFENIEIPAPRDAAAVLTRTYGDYKRFPPKEKRGTWHQDMILIDPDVSYVDYLNAPTSMRKAWFVTFADSRMKRPLRRIRRQALLMGFASDRILTLTENDLDPRFREKMKDRLVKGSRGYGYWCWRPQVVLQALEKMSDGEIMLYADAGCHLNPKGLPRLREYLKMADESGVVAFQGRSFLGTDKYDPLHHYNPVSMWTKGDVLDYFGVRGNEEITRSGQYSGGVFLVKKCAKTLEFYRRYRMIAEEHFEFFDDSPSASANLPDFREHRHDQAVFTLLCKEFDVRTLSCCEYGVYAQHAPERYRGDRNWSCQSFDEMMRYPVHARRDTSFGIRAYVPQCVKRQIWAVQARFRSGR